MGPQTRGFVSIIDINKLHKQWLQTQMGQLLQDDAMQPFVEDLKHQLKSKISGLREKLGVDLADLQDIAGGEIAIGLIERENDRASVALVVNVTGHRSQLDALLTKVDKELAKRDATKTTTGDTETPITTYQIPSKKKDGQPRTAVFFVKNNMLCVCDNAAESQEMLSRFDGGSPGLSSIQAYQKTMRRCLKESKGLVPELRWYVDPFGYARAIHSLDSKKKQQHHKDYVKILSEQGFDAITGLGGFVNLSAGGGSFELLHRTSVYAPPIPDDVENYRLAMRMMKFPNQRSMTALPWLPHTLATYRTFNCDLKNAFDKFDTLFDAIIGQEEAFAGMLEGLELDPYGPQVDIRKDFVAHLGERVVLVTDYKLPVTPKCERFLIAIQLTDEQAITKTVEKIMANEPDASQSEFEGKILWEVHEPNEDFVDLDISSSDLDLLDPVEDPVEEDSLEVTPSEASAVCVAEGHLFIASHAEFLKEVFSTKDPQDRLNVAADFRQVEIALSRLLPGAASVKSFVRTDEAFRPVYELLRKGKMPESETLLGRLLNRLLTPPDEEDEGILREQKIDGRQLPDFEMVRRYFGPAGTIIRSDEDGWMVVGATLSKPVGQARIPAGASADQGKLR
ncbi:MAG: DUF3352 domain-containing protein [Pirellulales bacterium]|nr:DUF3352 domain-containing protein [Pirellulales bacterium]